MLQEKLDHIIDGINVIIQNQKDLSNQLHDVRTQIEKNHNEEMEKLVDIQLQLVEIAATVNAQLFDEISQCEDFDNQLTALQFNRIRPVDYKGFRQGLKDYGNKCLEGLRNHLGAKAFDGRYRLARYENVAEAGTKWAPFHQRYKAIVPLLWEIAQQSGQDDGYFQSLRAPVRRMQDLDAKRAWSLDAARPRTRLFVSITMQERWPVEPLRCLEQH